MVIRLSGQTIDPTIEVFKVALRQMPSPRVYDEIDKFRSYLYEYRWPERVSRYDFYEGSVKFTGGGRFANLVLRCRNEDWHLEHA